MGDNTTRALSNQNIERAEANTITKRSWFSFNAKKVFNERVAGGASVEVLDQKLHYSGVRIQLMERKCASTGSGLPICCYASTNLPQASLQPPAFLKALS